MFPTSPERNASNQPLTSSNWGVAGSILDILDVWELCSSGGSGECDYKREDVLR